MILAAVDVFLRANLMHHLAAAAREQRVSHLQLHTYACCPVVLVGCM